MNTRMQLLIRNARHAVLVLAAGTLAACGGGDPFSDPGNDAGAGGQQPDTRAADMSLFVSSPDLPSASEAPVTVTALIRDANNNVVVGSPVFFTATSGVLTIPTEEGGTATDAAGRASAELGVGPDRANRDITVTARAGTLEEAITVRVIGTRFQVTGPSDVTLGENIQLTARLLDSANRGIPGQAIEVSSSLGNPLSSDSLTTSESGEVNVSLSASQAGEDTVEFRWAPASGSPTLVQSRTVGISPDQLEFVVPSSGTEVALGTTATITVRRLSDGAPVAGDTLSFSSTRGTLSAFSATTNAAGEASVSLTSSTAGPATITATQGDGASVQRTIEFVATEPATVSLRASSFTLAPEQTSDITALIRDAAGNPVKNATVVFSLNDNTGGSLTSGQGITDSTGRVTVVYRAGATSSAQNGVQIRAYPASNPAVEGVLNLTVARRELFVTIGTDNEIRELPNQAAYEVDFAIVVTDADGVGVANANVDLSAVSLAYRKGFWEQPILTQPWIQVVNATCLSEDVNRDGVYDPAFDENNNGRLDPGNVAAISAAAGGGTLVTDANGIGRAILTYPQDRAQWVRVEISARTGTDGTEFIDSRRLWLPIAASDVNASSASPPGRVSPYGVASVCSDPD